MQSRDAIAPWPGGLMITNVVIRLLGEVHMAAAAVRVTDTVAVGLYAADVVTRQGVTALLSVSPGIRVVDAMAGERCEVLLVVTSEVSEATLSAMQAVHARCDGEELAVVLVTNVIGERQVMRAVRFGLVSLLFRQDADMDRIVGAIMAARSGRAQLPGTVLRYLIDQIRVVERELLVGQGSSVLSGRELDVLRMLADGLDTNDVAKRLNYSERTVKNIVHGILSRLNLRNRTHAVAFALRVGVL